MKRCHPVKIIRMATGKSRAHFARMVGCSPDTIKSIEMGRLPVSKKMAMRIHSSTACDPSELLRNFDGKATDLWGALYTKDTFQKLQKHLDGPKGREWIQIHQRAVLGWVELVLEVADEKKLFPVVYRALIADWLIKVREDFNLGAAIDRELNDRKFLHEETYTLGDLRTVPGLAKQVGFRDSPDLDKESLDKKMTFHVKRSMKWSPFSDEPPPPRKPSPARKQPSPLPA
jgi:transcriptional regulator with XRE-family HTH domain